jgi:predicted RNase H-like nuclease
VPVRYVGIDLAWGLRNPTGLAVLDDAGTLLAADRAFAESEIVAWVRQHADGPVRVGIDAPISVPNLTGARPCERAVGRWFGRYGASCHPANSSMPVFTGGTRAARLVAALDLDDDPLAPLAPDDRRAWEVYPHQAAVMLFALPTVLRYKAKQGRDLTGLRAELLRLMDLLEGLADPGRWPGVRLDVTACPDWHRLRAAVSQAATKAALRRCEDPVDAVVCAHVARLAGVRPDATRVLGDGPSGHVLCVVDPDLATRIDAG